MNRWMMLMLFALPMAPAARADETDAAAESAPTETSANAVIRVVADPAKGLADATMLELVAQGEVLRHDLLARATDAKAEENVKEIAITLRQIGDHATPGIYLGRLLVQSKLHDLPADKLLKAFPESLQKRLLDLDAGFHALRAQEQLQAARTSDSTAAFEQVLAKYQQVAAMGQGSPEALEQTRIRLQEEIRAASSARSALTTRYTMARERMARLAAIAKQEASYSPDLQKAKAMLSLAMESLKGAATANEKVKGAVESRQLRELEAQVAVAEAEVRRQEILLKRAAEGGTELTELASRLEETQAEIAESERRLKDATDALGKLPAMAAMEKLRFELEERKADLRRQTEQLDELRARLRDTRPPAVQFIK